VRPPWEPVDVLESSLIGLHRSADPKPVSVVRNHLNQESVFVFIHNCGRVGCWVQILAGLNCLFKPHSHGGAVVVAVGVEVSCGEHVVTEVRVPLLLVDPLAHHTFHLVTMGIFYGSNFFQQRCAP
jgi:hypothetical protein